ncbi:hypothetical protein NUU61_003834 [Penicillium alfredii]|uniref:Uncharacterized protein n=1 Tax=Penicillium alfredii TaxID=1506179 RepID=A0A9W9KE21_9EURO|nr:uncharacterized protein NUU61_003834 [Penicillium alfredii]KAJ5101612.1 hypothetical protein NUU61_003834 [Penicillium alfredii]
MAQRQLSRTLPKNFTFPSLSADEPKTPERPSTNVEVPPPPRHSVSSFRLPKTRVRSGTDVCARMDLDLNIFRPPNNTELEESFSNESTGSDERFLAPPRERMTFKTPPAQIRGTPFDDCNAENPWPSWDQTPLVAGAIKRPGSACSSMSDSSVESIETFASRPSVGGSCSSVESDVFDSYFPLELPKELESEPPTLPKQTARRAPVHDKSWTREMDNHLWNTYQLYLQDPTITPFKMTPGSIPPLGVTSRVARRAKKTWDQKRRRIAQSQPTTSGDCSGNSTPKATENAAQPAWPKSDTKTRGRLKFLCRRKFSISPHYQRLMQSRSPEPVAEMFGAASEPRVRDFADTKSTPYATRDLGVSLTTPNDPTPLSQFAQETNGATESKTEWFNNPVAEESQNVPAPAPIPHLNVESTHSIPRLGSPFVYNTWGPGGPSRQIHNPPASGRRETVHAPGRRLRRNTQLEKALQNADDVFSNAPAGNKDPSDEQVSSRLELYIRDNKFQDIGHGRVRIRNRGATTGAVNTRDINQLFSPPSSLNSQPDEATPAMKPPVNPLLNLGGEHIKRLGSPFRVEGPLKRREPPRRFIRHAPSLSDPFSSGGPPSDSPMVNYSPSQEQVKPMGSLTYDSTEENLSDAERIRRQILNMPFSRK